jgi:hypothetical protein
VPQPIGKVRFHDGDTPELDRGYAVKGRGVAQNAEKIGIGCHRRTVHQGTQDAVNLCSDRNSFLRPLLVAASAGTGTTIVVHRRLVRSKSA